MRLIALILLLGTISKEQKIDFSLNDIKFNGLEFSTTKEAIINAFGQGKRVDTNYECGFFSNDQEGGPYYQLVYSNFNYIGSDKERFFYLEHVNFDADGSIKLMCLKKELTGRTTEVEFAEMFGDVAKEGVVRNGDCNSVLLYSKGSDDAAVFYFRNGRLLKFEYWTPC